MDHRSFLTAIAEQPDADASRRVYADWLDDHGEAEHAEFIRLQLLLAETDEYDLRRPALAERERELLIEHGMDWARVLVDHGALDWTFRKGTPCWATFAVEEFLRHGEAVIENTAVRAVHLTEAHGGVAKLAASPLVGRLRGLRLGDESHGEDNRTPLDDDDLLSLARSPHLGRLAALRVEDCTAGPTALAALLGATSLGRLEMLDLNGPVCGGDGPAVVAASPALAGLRRLRLRGGAPTPGAMLAMGESEHLRGVRELDLEYLEVNGQQAAALFQPTSFPRLERFALRRLTEQVAVSLCRSSARDNLEEIRVNAVRGRGALARLLALPRLRAAARLLVGSLYMDQPVGAQPGLAKFPGGEFRLDASNAPAGLVSLLREADLPNLRHLRLHWIGQGVLSGLAEWQGLNRLSSLAVEGSLDEGDLRTLADTPALSGLRRLELPLISSDVRAVFASSHLAGLESLSLDKRISEATVEALAASPLARACPDLAGLRLKCEWPAEWKEQTWLSYDGYFQLWAVEVGDDGITRLAACPKLARVRELDVGGNDMTPAGLRALLSSPHLGQLRYLRLSFNDALGDEGAALVAACPKLAELLSLKMTRCSVGDAGARALAESPYLTNLRVLKLWGDGANLIGDEGAKAIAASPNFRWLVGLNLTENAIGDEGAVALAESPYLNDLMYLYIRSGNRIGPVGEAALVRRFGGRFRWFQCDPYTIGLDRPEE